MDNCLHLVDYGATAEGTAVQSERAINNPKHKQGILKQ